MKKKIIITVITIVAISLTCIAIVFIMSNISDKKQVANDLNVTLNVMLGKCDETPYILSGDNAFESVISNESLEKALNEKCSYEIKKIQIKDNTAIVDLSFTSPDIYQYLNENIDEKSQESQDVLVNNIVENIETNVKNKSYEFQIELTLINDHWYLNPNSNLANALSGNLISWYSKIGENKVNALIEG